MIWSSKRVKNLLKAKAKPAKSRILLRFFKTKKGDYGEGDKFLGVVVPEQRKIVRLCRHLNLKEIDKLLHDRFHECRLTALLILVDKFAQADSFEQKQIFKLYLKRTYLINNWDLVDLSAPKIVGLYLLDKPQEQKILLKLAQSKSLWEKRISIISTYPFIKKQDFRLTLRIAQKLLNDKHDLIHKAVGWMLREIGKIDCRAEKKFLDANASKMPRVMLRYAIEKFSPRQRKLYLNMAH